LKAEKVFMFVNIFRLRYAPGEEENTSPVVLSGDVSFVPWLSPPLLLAEIGSFSWDSCLMLGDSRHDFSLRKS
jgi:hypothetical protein